MYTRYAERRGWKTEMMDINDTGMGGIKEAVILIKGKGRIFCLKYERAGYTECRVPETESSGRIHTSAATVAVLPEADDVGISIRTMSASMSTVRPETEASASIRRIPQCV